MRLAWKPLLLAILATLTLFLIPGTTHVVNAEVTTDLEADDTTIPDGGFTTVTFSVDPADGDVRVEVSSVSNTSDVTVTVLDCDACDEEGDFIEDNDDIDLTIEAAMTGDVELDVSTECADEDSFRIRITQGSDSDDINLICDPDEIGSFNDGDPLNADVLGFPTGRSAVVSFIADRGAGPIRIDANNLDVDRLQLRLLYCQTSRREHLDCADSDSTRDTVVINPDLVEEGEPNEDNDLFQIVMDLSGLCDYGAQIIEVTADQEDGVLATIGVACLAQANITIVKEVRHIDADFEFDFDIRDGECFTNDTYKRIKDGDEFTLADGQDMELICSVPGYYTVTEELDDQYNYDIECDVDGTAVRPSSFLSDTANINDNYVDIRLTDFSSSSDPGVFVTCVFTNTRDRLIEPEPVNKLDDYLPPAAAIQSSLISFFKSASILECSGTSTIVAMVKDANGAVVKDGTPVAFAATSGVLGQNIVKTQGGQAMTTFTASNKENEKTTITASAGQIYGITEMQSCIKQTAGVSTGGGALPKPPVFISPPSTGDGGLLPPAAPRSALPAALIAAGLALLAPALTIAFTRKSA